MSQSGVPLPPERALLVGRAALESRRFEAQEQPALEQFWRAAAGALDNAGRASAKSRLDTLGLEPGAARTAGGEPAAASPSADAQRQRASLELRLASEAQRNAELEKSHAATREELREALESLGVQQRKLREMSDERAKLLTEISRIETQLRGAHNELEQANLRFEKLKSSRQTLGEQATDLIEQNNTLRAENELLKLRVEAALQERDARVQQAGAQVRTAEAQTAEAAFATMWQRMHREIPEVFIETHVPTQRTFDQVCDALVEFVRVFAVLELHVQHMLRDLRQVSEKNDRLAHFYMIFTKNAGLAETLREHLVSGRKSMNLSNVLRAHQAWARAFGSGLYKVIVRSPVLIGEALSPKNWPIKKSFTQSEEAALGAYYKDVALKSIPEQIGTTLRKECGDMAYEDYNALMKRAK